MAQVPQQQYVEASLKTGNNLRQIAYSPQVRQLSHLSPTPSHAQELV
jgi:hypothetical protein